ncbi:RGG repeats nuclear RNA binding protein A-like isoform X2 [Malania oleifera]|uniref:RGG repeats nuclear RNA binding protein A-like isoform X2 n=1 Tax=Malania oleifera TaxID=397392 RepID=UPI0025AECBBD|nr:RGG repeats nuclear RNA binding protein A-like isoform X2 [Malania oleifera]
MARGENSFALLGDDEGDDFSTLLARVATAKSEAPLAADKKQKQPVKKEKTSASPADIGRDEKGRGRGQGGRGRGLRRSASDERNVVREGDGYQQNSGAEAYQQEYRGANGYRRNRVGNAADDNWQERGRGAGHGRGRGINEFWGLENENQGVLGSYNIVENPGQDAVEDGGWERVNGLQAKVYGSQGRSLREGESSWGTGERREYGGGHRGYRGREGRSNGGRDARNYGKGEVLNVPKTKEETHGDMGHEVSSDKNRGDNEWNVPVLIEITKDTEPEEGKQENVVNEDNSGKKNPKEEDNEMTLEEYEKQLHEKRKALEALKSVERKVTLDQDFESMQLVEKKKEGSIFIKLSEKDKDKLKRKESFNKEEKVRKVVSINEFLKPAEDGNCARPAVGHRRGGRGRGRGERGGSGGYSGGQEGPIEVDPAFHFEDPGQFPVLGGVVKA